MLPDETRLKLCGYSRCDMGLACDHSAVPLGPAWHDDENTETLWEVK